MKTVVSWIALSRICSLAFLALLLVFFRSDISFSLFGPILLVCYLVAIVSAILAQLKNKEMTRNSFLNVQIVLITLLAVSIFIAPPGPIVMTEQEASEAAAISTLRTIASAQEKYAGKWTVFGTAEMLGNEGLVDGAIRKAAESEPAVKARYRFAVKTIDGGKRWIAVAQPLETHETRWKSFFASSESGIMFTDDDVSKASWDHQSYPNKLGE